MAKDSYPGPPEAFESYESLVATNPEVDRKGAKTPYTSRNGHMFSFLDAEGVVGLRLSAQLREEFLDQYDSRIAEQHGRVMKEYVEIPATLLADTKAAKRWFDASHEWVGTLKPKPTTRKRG